MPDSTQPSAQHDPTYDSVWETVAGLRAWLDSHNRRTGDETLLLRVLKLSEEVGEVAEAVIGAMGQNPRKGESHSWQDVESELCDVVVTALIALRTLTPNAPEVLAAHLRRVAERSLTPRSSG
ncbi:MazG-like family protein [Streptomyces sp. NPDC090032]|uniref:MazG-like family protein n=1 Tax=unclassified Streptomyces TaxID=2593676 RepID=UPI00371BFD4B